MEPETLTEVIRWIGVVVALIASLLAAPEAVRHYTSLAVAKVHFWVRRGRTRHVHLSDSATVTSSVGITAEGAIGMHQSSEMKLTDRVTALEDKIQRMAKDVADLGRALEEQVAYQRDRIDRLGGVVDTISRGAEDAKRASVEINGRVLPLVGLGIVLSGVPDYLAAVPLLAIVLVAGALFSTALASDHFVRQWMNGHKRGRTG